jgi:signal transduction histidine kinase
VTERKLRVRRLEVLNRVLRHDLRTDAAVISGHADLLPSSPEAETIRERALAMAERGSDARRVAEALGDSADRRPLDLAALVERRTTDIDSATVQTHLEEATAYGSTALGMAVDELLENAIEHNDAADPTVRVTVDDGTEPGDRDRFVTLEIADDGPGLPRWNGRCSRPARRRRCSTPAGSGSESALGRRRRRQRNNRRGPGPTGDRGRDTAPAC